MTAQFSYQRLDDGTWGVKESTDLDRGGRRSGETVEVRTRAGAVKLVALGPVVTTWNGRRAALYRIAGRGTWLPQFARPEPTPDPERAAEQSAFAAEIADDIENAAAYQSHVDAAIREAWAGDNRVRVGETERSAFYDTTRYLIRIDPALDVDESRVRKALAAGDGRKMASYGTFGGYATIGRVTFDGEPGAFIVESVYHVGD